VVGQLSLEGVLQAMPTPLVLIEVGSGAVIYVNSAAERYPFAYQDFADHDAIEAGHAVDRAALPHVVASHGQAMDGRIVYFRDRTGQTTCLRFHAHRLTEQPIVVMTFDDLTPLHDSKTQLQDALVARDELVSMAAHELRSPISAVALAVEQISRKANAQGLDDIARVTEIAIRQIHRLTVLVSDLLDVSRLRAGRFELDREPAKLADAVREACAPLAAQAQIQNTQFSVEIETEAEGTWDIVRMDQVVTNLVTNALKYGEGHPIVVRLEQSNDGVQLIVQDGGPGIADEQRGVIFNPYHRATPRHKAQSLGLGLYIVREIVWAHGGSVALESVPGRTCFILTFPVKHEETAKDT
jgi:signal transduction histidine kinase